MHDTIILIPYRNCPNQYKDFVNTIVPILEKNMPISTKVIFIEQYGDSLFNRGKLLNVGCKLYKNKTKHFIFHNLNIKPDEDVVKRDYVTPLVREQVRGILVNASKTLGGVIKIKHDTLFMSNGHHNELWGWGLDDQEFRNRIDYYRFAVSFSTIQSTSPNVPIKGYKISKNEIALIEYDPNGSKRTFVEETFKKLTDKEKQKWILSSGVNNVDYTEVKRTTVNQFIDHIVVKI